MGKRNNKDVLKNVNYNIEVIKNIKSNKSFSIDEKNKMLNTYTGISKDNNSYFTPFEICDFIRQLLDIRKGKIADLSAGIGNMVRPFIKEYGILHDNIQFDCYELDENNSLIGSKVWEDYEQINFHGNFDSLNKSDEIKDNYYDFIIGNPPFAGSVKYMCQWNNTKGKAKNNKLVDCFVDLSIKKCKDKGLIALILPAGHLFNSNGTAKLRKWMKDEVALKAIFSLNSKTFENAGILGTTVGTNLIVFQKGAEQEKIFVGELTDKDIKFEMKSLAYAFRLFLSGNYHLEYRKDNYNGLHAVIKEGAA
jgi:type I restriction enzyme M protein